MSGAAEGPGELDPVVARAADGGVSAGRGVRGATRDHELAAARAEGGISRAPHGGDREEPEQDEVHERDEQSLEEGARDLSGKAAHQGGPRGL